MELKDASENEMYAEMWRRRGKDWMEKNNVRIRNIKNELARVLHELNVLLGDE